MMMRARMLVAMHVAIGGVMGVAMRAAIRVVLVAFVAVACSKRSDSREAPAGAASGSSVASGSSAPSAASAASGSNSLLDIDAVEELRRLPASDLPACEALRALIHGLDTCPERSTQQPWAMVTLVLLQSNLDDIRKAEACRAAAAEVRAKVPTTCVRP